MCATLRLVTIWTRMEKLGFAKDVSAISATACLTQKNVCMATQYVHFTSNHFINTF